MTSSTNVQLVAITAPVIPGIHSADEFIAYAARVSNPSNQMNTATSGKLLAYLIKHKHWSPFEMASMTVAIETTRVIAHQIVRHRSFSFQEFSQRYADPAAMGEMYVRSEARLQDTKNRQNSIVTEDDGLRAWWDDAQYSLMTNAQDLYKEAIELGIAKEVARNVLPEGLTKSRLYMAGTIRSWIHYLQARGPGSGTQKEHMDVAAEVLPILAEHFPSVTEALNTHGE